MLDDKKKVTKHDQKKKKLKIYGKICELGDEQQWDRAAQWKHHFGFTDNNSKRCQI